MTAESSYPQGTESATPVEIRRVRADGTIIHPRFRTPEQIARMHDRAKARVDTIVSGSAG